MYVVDGTEYTLMGRDWLNAVPLTTSRSEFRTVSGDEQVHRLSEIVQKHPKLFDDELGKVTHMKAKIELKEGAEPIRTKPHRVPYAMTVGVEKELERLQKSGVLTPIKYSEWSSGVVAVPKRDGSVRLCGNYKNTVNPALKHVAPPNINVDDILANLSGGSTFSKLDLAHAYNQLELEEESKKYLVLSTHKGLFQQNRLVFGITTAPAIWQNAIEGVLQGIPGVQIYLDDILITGRTQEEHMKNLNVVLTRLEE